MNGDRSCMDEDLHRFIDGELDDASSDRVQDLLERDPSLAARVRDYRSVDQALRRAFDDVEPPRNRLPNQSIRAKRSRVAAAALLLPAGFGAGWVMHSAFSVPEMLGPLVGGTSLSVQGREHLNTVFHIDVDERSVMEGVLNRAEAILTAYADQGAQVEVVANAAGSTCCGRTPPRSQAGCGR